MVKNFGRPKKSSEKFKALFLDVFNLSESESDISFLPKVLHHKILNWLSLVVHDCSIRVTFALGVGGSHGEFGQVHEEIVLYLQTAINSDTHHTSLPIIMTALPSLES